MTDLPQAELVEILTVVPLAVTPMALPPVGLEVTRMVVHLVATPTALPPVGLGEIHMVHPAATPMVHPASLLAQAIRMARQA